MQKLKHFFVPLCVSLLVLTFSPSFADQNSAQATILAEMNTSEMDKPRGQLLYETHCSACHDTSVHKRNPRKAESIGKIKYWVTRWSNELKLNWSSSDINEVTQYLNAKYYRHTE